MTKRARPKRARGRAEGATGLRRESFSALSSFLRGYLHEDFAQVHGSVEGAAAAFLQDADQAERRRVAGELESLIAALADRSMRMQVRFLTGELGSRWEPGSHDDLRRLLALLQSRTAP
jgi:hypothetical protein